MFKVSNKKQKRKTCSKLTIKTLKQRKKEHESNLIDVALVSLLLTLNIILTSFSSVSNAFCKHVFFPSNMTTIMVVTTSIYVNTTMIMTVTAITTMIMTMTATKTMIMTMIATTAMTKNMTTTMTKSITTNMTAIFKQVQKDNFYCLLKIIEKIMKIKFALPL